MITITEKQTKKSPGLTSLFVEFNYKPEIVEIIKLEDGSVYDKNTHIWEVPLTSLKRLVDKLCTFDDVELYLLPNKDNTVREVELNAESYKTKPFDYQLDGIKFGLEHDNWLLLDAPGLGKSLELIYLAQELKGRENIKHCLIICGINTLKANWKKEIKQHSDLSCRILGERVKKNGKEFVGGLKERIEDLKNPIKEFFVITNIETLRNEDVIKWINSDKNQFDMIIFDECHRAKEPTAQQTKGLLKIKGAKYKIAATGTLLMNNPVDCYVPLKWIGQERSNASTFKYYYCKYTGPFNNILIGYKNIELLKYQLSKCSLRRTKDLLNLPPKTVIDEYVDMNPQQQEFYDNIKNGIIDQVDKVEMSTANLLAMVARLRQATACPQSLTTENITSAKVERAIDLAEQIIAGGDKVVIFSTFKETLNPLMTALAKYNPTLNTGDIKDELISQNIDRFQTDQNSKVFLATHSKCGTGITLTAASYAIFIDVPWTSATFLQAQDRIYRIGSKSSVFIYHLICKETIDEHVLEIVNDKEAIADFVIDDKISQKSIDSLRKYITDLI